jgi:hypothetical protein
LRTHFEAPSPLPSPDFQGRESIAMGSDPAIALRIARTAMARNAVARRPARLISLDAFRGLVIVSMLVVNNIGDQNAVGYFWKHADWISTPLPQALSQWRHAFAIANSGTANLWLLGQFPLFRQCTMADFVMPWFMLIIGVAIPFSIAAARARNVPPTKKCGCTRSGEQCCSCCWAGRSTVPLRL